MAKRTPKGKKTQEPTSYDRKDSYRWRSSRQRAGPLIVQKPDGTTELHSSSLAFESQQGKPGRATRKREAMIAKRLHEMPYENYLKTKHWRELRQSVWVRSRGRCEECGSTRAVEVHHLTYKRRGAERLSDLRAVCRDCHRSLHLLHPEQH